MRTTLFLALALTGASVSGPWLRAGETSTEETAKSATIVETARAAGNFETLLAAVGAAGLADTLAGDGPFTVFAPTDEAFSALPEGTVETLLRPENRDRLVQILTFHVVSGELSAAAALGEGRLVSLEGSSLEVRLDGGRLRVNDAAVTANDLRTANGTIHVIDAVLLPAERTPARVDPRVATTGVLALAIDRGVPLFNAGQSAACAAVYEVAVRSILDRPGETSDAVLDALRTSLEEAARTRHATDAAWALRDGMDRALALLTLDLELRREMGTMTPRTVRIFDFDSPKDAAGWFSLNDDVMGGISTSRMVGTEAGTARFEGALSLENNGGFATVRSRARDLGLSGYDGLRFRVRGDGRTYRISGMTNDRRSEVRIWQHEFRTRAGEWIEVNVPFEELVLNIMGRRMPGAGPLPPEQIRALSFGIADKNETPFSLEIDWIEAFRGLPSI